MAAHDAVESMPFFRGIRILGLQRLQPLRVGDFHAAKIATPVIEGRVADPVLPAQIGRAQAPTGITGSELVEIGAPPGHGRLDDIMQPVELDLKRHLDVARRHWVDVVQDDPEAGDQGHAAIFSGVGDQFEGNRSGTREPVVPSSRARTSPSKAWGSIVTLRRGPSDGGAGGDDTSCNPTWRPGSSFGTARSGPRIGEHLRQPTSEFQIRGATTLVCRSQKAHVQLVIVILCDPLLPFIRLQSFSQSDLARLQHVAGSI